MKVQITVLAYILTLFVTAHAELEIKMRGKKIFDETIVRDDVVTANGILQTIRENFDLMETADGIVKLCDKMRMKFSAVEGNELFKATIADFKLMQGLMEMYPKGHYYVCPTHIEDDNLTPIQEPINAKYFDGTHTYWNSYGDSTDACDLVLGAPFFYSYSTSLIEVVKPPNLSPSILMNFPYVIGDEARNLGTIHGLGQEWNDILVVVGGEYPDVYTHQLILLPVKKGLCPDIVDPEKNTFDSW